MAITREEVAFLYRSMLGREAESDEVLDYWSTTETDPAVLGTIFVASPEFKVRHAPHFAQPQFPMAHAPDRVASGATPAQMARLLEHMRASWTHLGEEKPHFSVLSADIFLPETFDANAELFWRSGEENVALIARSLARHGFEDLSGLTCNEYGCGVGRLTLPLAARFAGVRGYDISAAHLAVARAHAEALGVVNIEFHDTSDAIGGALEPCDVYVSIIVLQHNPPPVIDLLLRRAFESLRAGGLAYFQLPIWVDGYQFVLEDYLAAPPSREIEMHYLPQSAVFALAAETGCEVVEARKDSWNNACESYTFAVRKRG
ncbi:MAG TPA: class I SAM-dependent methyltransferase [Caulobacteraceae bacterium]|jgi:SAM-dependent methyltransferase|nr:class I SAM-dependent methyltransferase [Caulobacteraceae bacterium]